MTPVPNETTWQGFIHEFQKSTLPNVPVTTNAIPIANPIPVPLIVPGAPVRTSPVNLIVIDDDDDDAPIPLQPPSQSQPPPATKNHQDSALMLQDDSPEQNLPSSSSVQNSSNPKQKEECKICFENPIDCVFVPCGHVACCHSCAKGVKMCPFCRKKIKMVVKMYHV